MALKRVNTTLEKVRDDEEIFVLRGQDWSSPKTILYWISENLAAPEEKLREAFECAMRMRSDPDRKAAD